MMMKTFLTKCKFRWVISGIPNPEYRKELMNSLRLLDNRKYMFRIELGDEARLYLLRKRGDNGYMFAVAKDKQVRLWINANAYAIAHYIMICRPRLELKQKQQQSCHACRWGDPEICDCLIK